MGFLDRRPFSTENPDGQELLTALLAAYDRGSAVREFVLSAGLQPAYFSWSSPMSEVWPEILRTAADQARLRSLIAAVARDPGSTAYSVIARLTAESAESEASREAQAQQSGTGRARGLASDAVGAWSPYLMQVERIAPPEPVGLVGRDAELSELARFCLEPDRGPYAWWQADAWAGKSALLSTFVLRPPLEVVAGGARVVSFFITARLAAQDTRDAFIQVLLEQLAALLGHSLPPVLPEATRDAYLLSLLSQAAAACRQAEGRLILVVDGLDEDRSVTTGPHAHSIAGLLPASPPHDMRVIVAGRPNPPVPDDVPDWHPLRDRRIIRILSSSSYARDVKRLSDQELRRLLRGSDAERDLLGLLTAARGGLSARDLEELTDAPRWEIEETLRTATGRTFTRRANRWAVGPETYLLGHEELQSAAGDYLGEARLARYRDRLHSWADAWRNRGWPRGTPEYLLTGYYRLLGDVEDLPRMIECAGDMARHDRMLDVTGGDAGALAETRSALNRIVGQHAPDLASALALASYRDRLVRRNAGIPAGLPVVWAIVGQLPRAEALAASITGLDGQVRAMAAVAEAFAGAGLPERADTVARLAEAAAGAIADPVVQGRALATVAEALAEAGLPDRAVAVAGQAQAAAKAITGPGGQVKVLTAAAGAWASVGKFQAAAAVAGQALEIAKAIGEQVDREASFTAVAVALARARQPQRALKVARSITIGPIRSRVLADVAGALAEAELHTQAEKVALSITDSSERTEALAAVVTALSKAGERERATAVAVLAEAAAQASKSSFGSARIWANAAGALAEAGLRDRVAAAADELEAAGFYGDQDRASVLADTAGALARVGLNERAAAVAGQAEEVARRIVTNPRYARAEALTDIARRLASSGLSENAAAIAQEAEAAARPASDPDAEARDRMRVLAYISRALREVGQQEQAAVVAEQAAANAGSVVGSLIIRGTAAAYATSALAEAGLHERAEVLARSIATSDIQSRALGYVVNALARTGLYERAEAVAQSITTRLEQAQALANIAKALAENGLHERAETVARSIGNPYARSQALADLAAALTASGLYERAEAVILSITSGGARTRALTDLARSLAAVGLDERAASATEKAERTASLITSPGMKAWALANVAGALAAINSHERADLVAIEAEATAWSVANREMRSQAVADVAVSLARAALYERAEKAARSITVPSMQASALRGIAWTLARAGMYERAEAVAWSITDSHTQAGVLADVVETLFVAGHIESGSRLAAVACSTSEWTALVRPVVLLSPSAYRRVLDVLEAPS